MGLIVSATPAYASIDDVRAFGVPDSITDEQIDDAIEIASNIIDRYTGTSFGLPTQTPVVINDVRKPLIVLPTPFSDVTAVEINGTSLDSTQWVVETWGLRIYQSSYYDTDGFPRWSLSEVTTGLTYGTELYGAQIIVTGTFGYQDLPALVRRATVKLAAREVMETLGDLVPDSRLKQLSVEGYRVVYDDTNVGLDTTGDLSVDRMLSGYRAMEAWVG